MIEYFQNISFVSPWYFLLLLIIPLYLFWLFFKKPSLQVSLSLSSVDRVEHLGSWKTRLSFLIPLLRAFSYVFFVLALARPQITLKEESVTAEGIDIMMVMDLSSSMLAQDFNPDRLSVSKEVAKQFVDKRIHDRIGLAVFAGESFTQCPLTTDHLVLKDFLESLQCGILADGTAIGMGLASAVNRLKDSESKSKIIILLTDGVNNSGYIKPITAAEIAQEFDVKVYTIGVGSTGNALTPVNRLSNGQYRFGMAKVEIDEPLLREISSMTKGRYYRAIDQESLYRIYDEIDVLEKTEIEVSVFKRYKEEYRVFLFIGLSLLLLEFILKNSILRRLP